MLPFTRFGLDHGLLTGDQSHIRFEGLISRQFDLDAVHSRTEQHGMKCSPKFARVSQKFVVHENSGSGPGERPLSAPPLRVGQMASVAFCILTGTVENQIWAPQQFSP